MHKLNLRAIVIIFFGLLLASICICQQPSGTVVSTQPPTGSVGTIQPLKIDSLPIRIEPPSFISETDPPVDRYSPPQVVVTGIDPTNGDPAIGVIRGKPTTYPIIANNYVRYTVTNFSREDVITADGIFFEFDNGKLSKSYPWKIVKKNHGMRPYQSKYVTGVGLRQSHSYVYAVLNVETNTGIWSVDINELTQAATDLVAGKDPILPKPTYKKK